MAGLLRAQRLDMLRFGAAGRLLAAGEVEAVLPLDDAELLDAARPVTPGGEVKADPERVRARQDAQVKAALQSGPVALIVLAAGDRGHGRRRCRPVARMRATSRARRWEVREAGSSDGSMGRPR